MQASVLPDIGIGGIFAILVIREVLNFLGARNGKALNGNGDGNGTSKLEAVTRFELDKRLSNVQFKDTCAEVVRRVDASVGSLSQTVASQQETARKHQQEVQNQYREIHTMLTDIQKGMGTERQQ